MPPEQPNSHGAADVAAPALDRFVRAGFERLGFEADETTMAVVRAVDSLYGRLIERLMEADLDSVEPEPGVDLSAPPPGVESR
jgi:hypothetical protein